MHMRKRRCRKQLALLIALPHHPRTKLNRTSMARIPTREPHTAPLMAPIATLRA